MSYAMRHAALTAAYVCSTIAAFAFVVLILLNGGAP